MKNVIRKIKAHDFTKELKSFEYEVKFNVVKKYRGSLAVLIEAKKHFQNHPYLSWCDINSGDRLVTKVDFFFKDKTEYSIFDYKGVLMIKVKRHAIIPGKQFKIFKNFEELLVNKQDYYRSAVSVRQRLYRHKHRLVDLAKTSERFGLTGSAYVGKMTKDRVKAFLLDRRDGRVYAIAVAFCRCAGRVQKQLEIEYAGYIPGFPGIEKGSERQILVRLSELAQYTHRQLSKVLRPSTERKFSFVQKLNAK